MPGKLKQVTVFIYLANETVAVPAGVFSHDQDQAIGTFAYGRRYVERPNVMPVDPVALPLGRPTREATVNGGLYGAFRDASPDYWGRLVIAAAKRTAPEALSEMDFLVEANATRVGNLDFRSSPNDPEPDLRPPLFEQLADIVAAAHRIETGHEVESHFLQLLRQGSSMGGARPKCTMEDEKALWIAKFAASCDTVNIPRIEYATMTLAGRAGIRVPEMRIVAVGQGDVLLVRRFDREKSEQGWLRRGFLSGLSLMQWDERDRLSWDYAAMADAMRRFGKAADIRELFRRMVFNILVRNTDDHPRNHGFLVDSAGVTLSPAYDILPSLAQPGIGTDFRLAMAIGAQGRDAKLENALTRAGRFGLNLVAAREEVARLRETAATWREHFEECGVAGREIDLLAPSFARCRMD